MNGVAITNKIPRDLAAHGYALVYTATDQGYVGRVDHEAWAVGTVDAITPDVVVLTDAYRFLEQVGQQQGGGMGFGFAVLPLGGRGYRDDRAFAIRGVHRIEWFHEMHASDLARWVKAVDAGQAIREDLYAQQSGIALARVMPSGPRLVGGR